MTVTYDPEYPLAGQYVSPNEQKSDEEEHVSSTLAHLFVAAVVAAKAADWLGLAKKWSDGGYRSDDLHRVVSRRFTDVFWQSAGSILVRAAEIGSRQAIADFEMEIPREDWDRLVGTWAQVYGHEMAKQVAQQSEKAIAQLVPQMLNRGLRGESLANQVKSLYGLDPRSMNSAVNFLGNDKKPRDRTIIDLATHLLSGRAKIIGDVQSFTALNFGRQLTYMEAQDAGLLPKSARKVWVTAIDERVCKVCRPMDGRTVGLNDFFHVGDVRVLVPPVHPNCLLPDSRVTATGITSVSDRWYDGEIVIIRTARGNDLRSTPNHPILTNHGWVAAGDLVVGDDVISSLRSEWQVDSNDDKNDMPPTIQEVAEALGCSGEMSSAEVPVSTEDFHGDGTGSQVAVVWTNSLLPDYLQTSLCEHLVEQVFAGANMGKISLPYLSHTASLFESSLSPSNGIMGSTGQSLPFVSAGVTHAGIHGVTSVAGGDSSLYESSSDDWSADGQALSQRLLALSSEVSTDKIISVDRETVRHQRVLNLETVPGWYIANGIVTHNCRCTTVPEERFKNGIITRTARFSEDRHHRSKLVTEIEDLVLSKSEPVEKINLHHDALGRFAAGTAVALGAKYAFDRYPKSKAKPPVLPRHLRRIDRKVHRLRSGTYQMPRQYLDFHRRGQSFRFDNEAHIQSMASDMRKHGYRMKPITLHVYDDAVDVEDGNHRVEAAYRARLGFVPTRVVRIKGTKPKDSGVVSALRNRRTNDARSRATARYVVNLENTRRSPFSGLNSRLIAQDERNHQWHTKNKPRNIRPL